MIIRLNPAAPASLSPTPLNAWERFSDSQQQTEHTAGYVTQPAHAALAGRLAGLLTEVPFGLIPPAVLEIIGKHDAGWAGADLSALEGIEQRTPVSFLKYPVPGAVDAWRKCIRAAESESQLSGVLTSRHFCLLASPDDPLHLHFRMEEAERRRANEAACGFSPPELDRFLSTLGFCDLLSLYLSSGVQGTARVPLAHPADPAAEGAHQVCIWVKENQFGFDMKIFSAADVQLQFWQVNSIGKLSSQTATWTVS